MIESAPLHISIFYPLGSSTITLILFLVEVNSRTFKSLYLITLPVDF